MLLYLTRQRNGLFMLTKELPAVRRVGNSEEFDVYVPLGDPIGVRNLCDVLFLNVGSDDLEVLKSKQINVIIKEITNNK